MGLILDSSILIAAERQKQTITQLIEQIVSRTGNGETALSAIGLTELAHAVHRAPTGQLRALHQNFLEDVLATFEVYPYIPRIQPCWLAGSTRSKGPRVSPCHSPIS